jgi:hypothetical protein
MAKLDVLILIGLLAKAGAAQFNLYPPIDPTSLAKAFNVTAECIQALSVGQYIFNRREKN